LILENKNGIIGYSFLETREGDEDDEEIFSIKDIAVLPEQRSKSLDLIRATLKKCERFSKIWEFEARNPVIYKLLKYFEKQKRIKILEEETLEDNKNSLVKLEILSGNPVNV
jgi:hypothetical protein